MTRNLFLGADLAPAINAPDIPTAIDGAGTVWNELQSTKFPERAVPLAREIKALGRGSRRLAGGRAVAQADAVGRWGEADQPARGRDARDDGRVRLPRAAAVRAQEGRRQVQVAVVQEEFEAELPVDADHDDTTGTGPLAGFGADFDARLTMRDVILVRTGSKVKVGKARTGHYKTRYEPSVGGIEIPVDRGWTSVEAKVGTRAFRFLNTHLEAFGDPKIREAQAKELTKGPLKTKEQVILVGDLNSGDAKDHEPEQPGDELAFKALTGFGLKNNGARQSCCFESLFDAERRLRSHRRPRAVQAGPEDGQGIGHRPRRIGAHAVGSVAVRPRWRRQPGAAPLAAVNWPLARRRSHDFSLAS